MAYDEQLGQRIRDALRATTGVSERKMFGGLTFLVAGRMCCGIVGKDLMVRVNEDEFEEVMRDRHVRPMDFTGRPLKGFVYVSPPGVRTPAMLKAWVDRGRRFVRQASATSKRSTPRTSRTRSLPARSK